MDFGFTEEHKMMQETIRKLVEREYPLTKKEGVQLCYQSR